MTPPEPAPGRRPLVAAAASPLFPDLHDDWPLLRAALGDFGVDARTAVWSDSDVDWASFDLVVANGAWDNIHRAADFLAWAAALEAAGVPTVNAPAILRWNLDKRYLRDLEAGGVQTVPTHWIEPDGTGTGSGSGSRIGTGTRSSPADPPDPFALDLGDVEVVVKPSVSGGGFQTARYQPHELDEARAHIGGLAASGRTVMVQPYVRSVDAVGERGLVFLGGVFSHAIHKDPMIRRGAGATESLIENQVTREATPTAAELRLARLSLEVAETLLGPTAYARVDVVTLDDGAPALLELELLDPVLFFVHAPDAAHRFARVLVGLLEAG
jgi:hypothetical protein